MSQNNGEKVDVKAGGLLTLVRLILLLIFGSILLSAVFPTLGATVNNIVVQKAREYTAMGVDVLGTGFILALAGVVAIVLVGLFTNVSFIKLLLSLPQILELLFKGELQKAIDKRPVAAAVSNLENAVADQEEAQATMALIAKTVKAQINKIRGLEQLEADGTDVAGALVDARSYLAQLLKWAEKEKAKAARNLARALVAEQDARAAGEIARAQSESATATKKHRGPLREVTFAISHTGDPAADLDLAISQANKMVSG